ncbi:MAG: hypothetical protein ACR2LT_01110 [Pyrinomonadaceae bacterium]
MLLIALPVMLLAVAVIGGWLIFADRNKPLTVENNNIESANQTAANTVSLNNDAPAANNNIAQNTLTSAAAPKPDEAIDLSGTWAGTSGVTPATLMIENYSGNNFSGTKNEGSWQAAFTGDINPVSRQVIIRETKLLKGDSRSYSLGVNTGTLSKDGKKMSGKGKDGYSTYPWTFSRR